MPETLSISTVLLEAATFDFNASTRLSPLAMREIPDHVDEFLDSLERNEVDFVLVAGLALLRHIPGRNTRDIDLIVSLKDIRELDYIEIHESDRHFATASFKSLRIDILRTRDKFFNFIRRNHSEQAEFDGRSIPCATPRGLVLMKLFALPALYWQLDFDRSNIYESDIARLLHSYPMDSPDLVETLEPFLNEPDLNEIGKLLAEIQQRIQRFRKPGQ